jgi:translocator protein
MPSPTDPPERTFAWQALGLFAWLLVTFAAAAVGALATVDAAGFYAELRQPYWAPPAEAFPLVWSVLYLMTGTAAWLVWREQPHRKYRPGLLLYGVQLVLNAAWPWLFFGLHYGAVAFAEIVVLCLLVFFTTAAFWRNQLAAGLLMLPYLLWVAFAATLTYTLWQMNPIVLRTQQIL